jgi:hypothetical protein
MKRKTFLLIGERQSDNRKKDEAGAGDLLFTNLHVKPEQYRL